MIHSNQVIRRFATSVNLFPSSLKNSKFQGITRRRECIGFLLSLLFVAAVSIECSFWSVSKWKHIGGRNGQYWSNCRQCASGCHEHWNRCGSRCDDDRHGRLYRGRSSAAGL